MSEGDRRPRRGGAGESAATEADRYEQEREVVDESDGDARDVPEGVDPADAHEQQLVVDYDEDDYR